MVIGSVAPGVGADRAAIKPRRIGRASGDRPEPQDRRPPKELPRSIRRAAGLEGFAGETIALASPARATAAARAFSAGNGYLPGLIVDRRA